MKATTGLGLLLFTWALTAQALPYNWEKTAPSQAITLGMWSMLAKHPQLDGSGMTIAVMDTGLDLTRPWFSTATRPIEVYDFTNAATSGTQIFGNTDTVATDGWAGHGTAAATFATASGALDASNTFRGVAPNAHLIFLRVNPNDLNSFERALRWIKDGPNHYGIKVLSMSLGWGAGKVHLQKLFDDGIFMVSAGGNDNQMISNDQPWVFRVSGTTLDGSGPAKKNGKISAWGPGIHFAAPAVNLWVAYPNPVTPAAASLGTSWATPTVAGLAALVRQVNPALSPNGVKDLLRATGVYTTLPDDHGYTYPVINADAALDRVCADTQNPLCQPPVVEPAPITDYDQCPLAGAPGSWIRDSYRAGGLTTIDRLGCPRTAELLPPAYAKDGRYTYQEFEKNDLCIAWDWKRPNNWVYSNFIIMSCASVKGRPVAAPAPPAVVQDCPLFPQTLAVTDNSWIAQSFMTKPVENFALLGCPTEVEQVPNPQDGRYGYMRFDKGCMAWDWTKPRNYVPTNFIPKTTGCP